MAFVASALNDAVNGIAAAGTFISFHTADPGATGANEIAATRPATTWGTASNGTRAGSQVSQSIGAGVTVTHWGLWSAATAGTFKYGGALAAPEAFGSAGTIQHTPTLTVTN